MEDEGRVQLNVRVPPELLVALRERVEASGETLSDIVRNAIAEHLGTRLPDADHIDALSLRVEQLTRQHEDGKDLVAELAERVGHLESLAEASGAAL